MTKTTNGTAARRTWMAGCALTGTLMGALVVGCGPEAGGADAAKARDDTAAAVKRLEKKLAELESSVASTQGDQRAVDRRLADVRNDVSALTARVLSLEERPGAAPGDVAAAPDPATQEEIDAAKTRRREEMLALQKKVFSGKATPEEQQRFWEMARTTGIVGELMKQLEGEVAESPGDNELRMNLAQAYIAKLLSIPGGPEQGVWAMKAETQWKAVLERDPNHWDARYSIAFSWSQYPEFLNKTPDAIKEFEKVREVQELQTPQGKHAQTYVQLSILYRRQGNDREAREMLRLGAERHPDDAGIQKALSSMGDE